MTSTLAFAIELIERESVTPEDAGCQTLIADRLSSAGFAIEHMRYDNVDNLWARRGTDGPVFCFAGHTDVVPPGPTEDWSSDPFKATIAGDMLRGRGAADMKSALAAMVDATVNFVSDHPDHQGSIAFLITSDEEGRAQEGTKKAIRTLTDRGDHIDWCVIGEPSSTNELGDAV